MLYAYGGFNVSLTPSFSIANAVWLEKRIMPFLICVEVVNIKNGTMQELKCKKQNVFDDFIAAEYLIAQKYTSSNSCHPWVKCGLLVGAMTQRPELMKVALPGRSDGHVTLPYLYSRSRLGLRLRNFTGQQRDV
jgi:prolyl oligopeptidase